MALRAEERQESVGRAMTTWTRAVTTATLTGVLWMAGPAPAAADTIGTLDWYECSDGALTLGDASNEFECLQDSSNFARFALIGFGIVDFLSASVELTIGQSTTSLEFSPDPVGSFGTTLPGPAGAEKVVLLLQVAPGVVTNLTLPTLFRPAQVSPGDPVSGNIDADLVVPEPASVTLLAAGLLLAGLRRRAVPLTRS